MEYTSEALDKSFPTSPSELDGELCGALGGVIIENRWRLFVIQKSSCVNNYRSPWKYGQMREAAYEYCFVEW